MKLFRFCALLGLFAVVCWNNGFAQSVTFSDLRLEQNVPDDNGKMMLQFHYKMSVTGCQGHDVKVYMYVDIPQGTGHKFANGDQVMSKTKALQCTQETTSFNRWVGIYNDRLNPLPGKNTYYTRLWVKDEDTGKWIGHSDFLSFENTGSVGSASFSDNSSKDAVLNNCYVVHKDKNMESKQTGMRFHLNLTVRGEKGKKVWCIIEVAYNEEETSYWFNGINNNYEYNKHLAVLKQLNCTYENSLWEDLQLFLPYEEIKKSIGNKSWDKSITYCVKVVEADGNVVFQEWQSQQRIGYHQTISQPMNCYSCSGTGRCNMCYGRGGTYGYYGWHSCNHCLGKGTCPRCGGTRKIKISSDVLYSYDINTPSYVHKSTNSNTNKVDINKVFDFYFPWYNDWEPDEIVMPEGAFCSFYIVRVSLQSSQVLIKVIECEMSSASERKESVIESHAIIPKNSTLALDKENKEFRIEYPNKGKNAQIAFWNSNHDSSGDSSMNNVIIIIYDDTKPKNGHAFFQYEEIISFKKMCCPDKYIIEDSFQSKYDELLNALKNYTWKWKTNLVPSQH